MHLAPERMESGRRAGLTGAVSAADPGAGDCVDLYWIPLGSGRGIGPRIVRLGGRSYAAVQRARGLAAGPVFHAALVVRADAVTRSVEMAPAWGRGARGRDVVGTGPVGMRFLGRSAMFRYEIRCSAGTVIPDLADAVDSPVEIATGVDAARRVLLAVESVPRPTWGRDALATGQMWNSNSLVAWALSRAGVDLTTVRPPAGGIAPGWEAGVRVAARRSS